MWKKIANPLNLSTANKISFWYSKKIGIRPFIRRNGGSVQLENKEEINYYFKIIGTSNKKHLTRYLEGYV